MMYPPTGGLNMDGSSVWFYSPLKANKMVNNHNFNPIE